MGEFSNYTLRAYSSDFLAAAYIEDNGEKNQNTSFRGPSLVYLDYHNTSLKIDTHELPKAFELNIPIFFVNDTVWTHVKCATDFNSCGVVMGIDSMGYIKSAKLFTRLHKELVPSGWLAGFLPKLYDIAIRQGLKNYYDWGLVSDKNNGTTVL